METRKFTVLISVIVVVVVGAALLWTRLTPKLSATAAFTDPGGHPMEYVATINVTEDADIRCVVGNSDLGTDSFAMSISPDGPVGFNGELKGGSGAADASEDSVPIDCQMMALADPRP